MTIDLILAAAHHILMFAIVTLLVVEAVMIWRGLSGRSLILISRIDVWFGATAGMIVLVGFLRVFLGAKPSEFYLESPYFWAKIAAIAVVAILSIGPTLRFIGWGRAARADQSFQPTPGEIVIVKRFILAEAAIFVLIPIFAAVMARGYGLG